jgi:hypothetical protein
MGACLTVTQLGCGCPADWKMLGACNPDSRGSHGPRTDLQVHPAGGIAFLRRRIARKAVDKHFDQALDAALKLAKSGDADYLPGWCGPVGN